MSASNFWILILYAMVFMIGIDSAFSFIEATTTTINDMAVFNGVPKMLITFVVCFCGFLFSIPFTLNWGLNLQDTMDHYINNYVLVLVGCL